MYYNHGAAQSAARKFEEGTEYEEMGDRMLPRAPEFEKGEGVEVEYEGEWYQATIERRTIFEDDIRYSVHYTKEDTTQSNVSEKLIRKVTKKRTKVAKDATGAKKKKVVAKSRSKSKKTGNEPVIVESQKEKKTKPRARAVLSSSKKRKMPGGNESVTDFLSAGGRATESNNKSEFSASETKTADDEHGVENASKPKAKRGRPRSKSSGSEIRSRSKSASKTSGRRRVATKPHGESESGGESSGNLSSAKGRRRDRGKKSNQGRRKDGSANDDDSSLSESEGSRYDTSVNLAHGWGLPMGWKAYDNERLRYQIFSPQGEYYQSKYDVLKMLHVPMPPLDCEEDTDACLAQSWGLPGGWKAYKAANQHYRITSPKGKRYRSKLQVLNMFGLESNTKNAKNDYVRSAMEEEGDPPWRREEHEYFERIVRYNTGDEVQEGKVTGWLDSRDLDSEGNPAFVSERTGKPATLFHVNFAKGDVLFVDLEEYELMECLLKDCTDTKREEEDDQEADLVREEDGKDDQEEDLVREEDGKDDQEEDLVKEEDGKEEDDEEEDDEEEDVKEEDDEDEDVEQEEAFLVPW